MDKEDPSLHDQPREFSPVAHSTRVMLFLYRHSPLRRAALEAPPDDPSRYSLYGADILSARGRPVAVRIASPAIERRIFHWPGYFMDRAVRAAGWSSGQFASALAMLRDIRRAAVVIATVDALGIPLLWFRRAGLFRTPLIYVSVGFPERLDAMAPRGRAVYLSLLRRAAAVIAFGHEEANKLKFLIGDRFANRVHFVPFGVHESFCGIEPPAEESGPDVLSIGADPMRDFDVLIATAVRRRDWSFDIIAGGAQAERLADVPQNVRVVRDLPLQEVRERMRRARLIVLPVRENSYSGATTTLLQAMAIGKPVVVSRVGAIRDGYGFVDGEHLRWVPPGDAGELERAIDALLRDPARRRAISISAAAHVRAHLSWSQFVNRLEAVIDQVQREACAA